MGERRPWKRSAEEELARDPRLRRVDITAVQEWIKTNSHLPQVEDEMVCHFLHACSYQVEQTKRTLEHFYTYKTTMPDFFDNWDPTDQLLQDTVNNVMIAAGLPQPDPDGNRVIVCKLNDTSTERFVYPACIKWILMSCIHALWLRGIEPGYVIVYDATGYSLSHLFKCSLTNIRNYINYGKNASPIRVVKIVFINTSSVVSKLLTLVKPFLNKEIINMMAFYKDADSYFGNLPKEMVPEDYGGEAPPLLSLHREGVRLVTEAREHLMAEETVRVDSSKKKTSGKTTTDRTTDESTSLRKLEID